MVLLEGKSIGQNFKTRFTVNGKLSSDTSNFTYLNYLNSKGVQVSDSCLLTNGIFSFKGNIEEPTIATISNKVSSRDFFIEPASIIKIEGTNFMQAKIIGSKTQNEYEKLNTNLQKVKNRWTIVMDTLKAANKRSNAEFQKLKGWVLIPYFKEIKDLEYTFYDKHPESYVTAYSLIITGRDLTTDSLKLFYDRFPEKLKRSSYGKNVYAQLEKRKLGVPGTLAAEFTTSDINGNKFSLADFRGKYVLLDFWGSWCVPCRKENPHLKELYSKYKEKEIEFIGIAADDDTQEAWRKAVKDDGLPWPQILKGKESERDIAKHYNIIYYPTKILIDKKGEIIGRFGEESAELDIMLQNIFN